MATWFSRRKRRIEVPRLRPRTEDVVTTKVDLHEFTPPPLEFLGRAAYVQLTLFENLSLAISSAPTTAAKAAIGAAAEGSIARHRALAAEIEKLGSSVADAMDAYTGPIDEFERVTRGSDWFEQITTCYLTTGFLDDFFARLAPGLPSALAERVEAIFAAPTAEAVLADQLEQAITANPRLASRLAMWGRRLVGDTMLVCRTALHFTEDQRSDEARVEPVFSELIAAHTRRMDALGLTA